MTSSLKAQVLFNMLRTAAPMSSSEPRFKTYVETGDPHGLWVYYQECLRAKPEMDERIEAQGLTSFRMLKPAMEAVYQLPVTCDCGCGGTPKSSGSRFLPGHDLRKLVRGQRAADKSAET